MKRILQLIFLVLVIALSGCSKKVTAKKTPAPVKATNPTAPGQIKKATGSQSAAPYAPGQQKKAATPSADSNKGKKAAPKTTEGGNSNAGKKKK